MSGRVEHLLEIGSGAQTVDRAEVGPSSQFAQTKEVGVRELVFGLNPADSTGLVEIIIVRVAAYYSNSFISLVLSSSVPVRV